MISPVVSLRPVEDADLPVFLVHEQETWGLRSDVKGFKPHPLDYYVLTADLSVG